MLLSFLEDAILWMHSIQPSCIISRSSCSLTLSRPHSPSFAVLSFPHSLSGSLYPYTTPIPQHSNIALLWPPQKLHLSRSQRAWLGPNFRSLSQLPLPERFSLFCFSDVTHPHDFGLLWVHFGCSNQSILLCLHLNDYAVLRPLFSLLSIKRPWEALSTLSRLQ